MLNSENILAFLFEYTAFPFAVALLLRYFWLVIESGVFRLGVFHEKRLEIFSSALIVALIFLIVGPAYRVLADETNLLSIARSIVQDWRAVNITEQLNYFGENHPLTTVDAYRPILFPTLLALVGLIFGLNEFTPFIVNAIVGFAAIFVFSLFPICSSRNKAVLGMVFFAAFPQFQLNITSGGFEALFLLMFMLLIFHFLHFLKSGSDRGFEIVVVSALLAAQTRYEAVVFLLIPMSAFVLMKLRHAPIILFKKRYFAYSVLALPIIIQKLITSSYANEGDASQNAFSLSYFTDNLIGSFNFIFIDGFFSAIPWAGFLLLAAAALLWLSDFKKNIKLVKFEAVAPVFLVFLLILLSHMTYYMGDYGKPWISRLSTVHLVWIAPVFLGFLFFAFRGHAAALFFLVLFFFLLGANKAAHHNPGSGLLWAREFNVARDFLSNFSSKTRTLVVSDRSGMYVALGYSAVSNVSASRDQAILSANLKNGLFDRIVISQVVGLNADPSVFNDFPGFSDLRVSGQKRIQIDDRHYARLSVLTSSTGMY